MIYSDEDIVDEPKISSKILIDDIISNNIYIQVLQCSGPLHRRPAGLRTSFACVALRCDTCYGL